MAKRSRATKKSNLAPVLIIGLVFLLGIGALVYSAVRRSTGNPIINNQDNVPRISVEDAYAAVQSGEAILVDTRLADQFTASHAVGAISVPVDQAETLIPTLDPDAWYITYCT